MNYRHVIDGNGNLVLLAEEGPPDLWLAQEEDGVGFIHFAASYNPSATGKGNPWHDPRTGQFADAPPGVRFLTEAARGVMHAMGNVGKNMVNEVWKKAGGDRIMAVDVGDGRAYVTLWNGVSNTKVASFYAPMKDDGGEKKKDAGSKGSEGDGHDSRERRAPGKTVPQEAPPEELYRRDTAVRKAAQELGQNRSIDLDSIREFLRTSTVRPLTDTELVQFHDDVKRQWLNNILDGFERDRGGRRDAAQSLILPTRMNDRWLADAVPYMTRDDVHDLIRMARDRGWDESEITRRIIPQDRKSVV